MHQELHHYYSQIIVFQDKDSQYQNIANEFSKILLELDNIIEDIRKYNNNIMIK